MSETTRTHSMPNVRLRSRWRRWLLLVVGALALVTGRVLYDSWSAFSAGAIAEAKGAKPEAIRSYLHAIRMYVPGSPFVARSLDRLEALAAESEQAGDTALLRQALEAVRAGLLGARSFYTPYADRLVAANGRLAAIYARIEDPAVAPGASFEARQAWHQARLDARPGPSVAATLAALGGLGLWLAAAVIFIRRGVDRGLRLQRRWAAFCGVAFFLGFALFVLGLRFA